MSAAVRITRAMLDDAWVEGVKHEHELVIANVRRTALHRRDDATLCVCMTCGITWREDTPAEEKDHQ